MLRIKAVAIGSTLECYLNKACLFPILSWVLDIPEFAWITGGKPRNYQYNQQPGWDSKLMPLEYKSREIPRHQHAGTQWTTHGFELGARSSTTRTHLSLTLSHTAPCDRRPRYWELKISAFCPWTCAGDSTHESRAIGCELPSGPCILKCTPRRTNTPYMKTL